MRAENRILRQQALDRSQRLATVRYCVLLSQTYLNGRIGYSPPDAEVQIRERWNRMMSELGGYTADGDAQQFLILRKLVEQHWQGLSHALGSAGNLASLDAGPLRVSALQITERVEDMDARQTAAAQLM